MVIGLAWLAAETWNRRPSGTANGRIRTPPPKWQRDAARTPRRGRSRYVAQASRLRVQRGSPRPSFLRFTLGGSVQLRPLRTTIQVFASVIPLAVLNLTDER